jgi:hypothetical protein
MCVRVSTPEKAKILLKINKPISDFRPCPTNGDKNYI